ncbi:MAG: hypothetical protein J6386_14525 [Candidatus Synoicihabitans palmerolidicus]|nr:hypothetical protein [Candidatus Synoicihabitans palmerolidicus]
MSAPSDRYREGAEYEFAPDPSPVASILDSLKRYLAERGFPASEFASLELARPKHSTTRLFTAASPTPTA